MLQYLAYTAAHEAHCAHLFPAFTCPGMPAVLVKPDSDDHTDPSFAYHALELGGLSYPQLQFEPKEEGANQQHILLSFVVPRGTTVDQAKEKAEGVLRGCVLVGTERLTEGDGVFSYVKDVVSGSDPAGAPVTVTITSVYLEPETFEVVVGRGTAFEDSFEFQRTRALVRSGVQCRDGFSVGMPIGGNVILCGVSTGEFVDSGKQRVVDIMDANPSKAVRGKAPKKGLLSKIHARPELARELVSERVAFCATGLWKPHGEFSWGDITGKFKGGPLAAEKTLGLFGTEPATLAEVAISGCGPTDTVPRDKDVDTLLALKEMYAAF